MAPIAWKPEYSVGNPEVDHEHKELVELVNQTATEILKGEDPEAVERDFGELLRAISSHFALEEQEMQGYGYDQLDVHKADHENLLDELRDIMDGTGENPDKTADRLVATLEAWFTTHFKTHDARLHNQLG